MPCRGIRFAEGIRFYVSSCPVRSPGSFCFRSFVHRVGIGSEPERCTTTIPNCELPIGQPHRFRQVSSNDEPSRDLDRIGSKRPERLLPLRRLREMLLQLQSGRLCQRALPSGMLLLLTGREVHRGVSTGEMRLCELPAGMLVPGVRLKQSGQRFDEAQSSRLSASSPQCIEPGSCVRCPCRPFHNVAPIIPGEQ